MDTDHHFVPGIDTAKSGRPAQGGIEIRRSGRLRRGGRAGQGQTHPGPRQTKGPRTRARRNNTCLGAPSPPRVRLRCYQMASSGMGSGLAWGPSLLLPPQTGLGPGASRWTRCGGLELGFCSRCVLLRKCRRLLLYAGLKMLCAAMQCHVVVGGGQRRVTRDSGGPRFCSFGRPYLL